MQGSCAIQSNFEKLKDLPKYKSTNKFNVEFGFGPSIEFNWLIQMYKCSWHHFSWIWSNLKFQEGTNLYKYSPELTWLKA